MRVINVVMQNYIGGPQVRVVSVAEKLLARGVETVVCAPSGHDNPLEEYVRTHGLEFEGFFMPGLREFRGFGDVIKNLIWVLSVPLTVIQMIMIIRRTRADVVHVNGVLKLPGCCGRIHLQKEGCVAPYEFPLPSSGSGDHDAHCEVHRRRNCCDCRGTCHILSLGG